MQLKVQKPFGESQGYLVYIGLGMYCFILYTCFIWLYKHLVIKGVKDINVNFCLGPLKAKFLHVCFGVIKMKHLLCLRKKPELLHLEFSDPHWFPDHTFCCCTKPYVSTHRRLLSVFDYLILCKWYSFKVCFFWILMYIQDSNICY